MNTAKAQISTIIFDIGKVILRFDYLKACHKLMEVTGYSKEVIDENFFFTPWQRQYSRGEISSEEFYGKIKEDLNLSLSYEEFIPIWNDIYWVNEGTEKLIQKLKDGGKYRLAAITNTNDLHFKYWVETYEPLKAMEAFFTSHEVGVRKPDEKIYHTALEQLKVSAEETAFIDDLEANVKAANQLGIHGVHYTEDEKLITDLKQLGIEF